MLLVPFLCAAGVAGAWSWPLVLAGVCVVSFFLLRGSVEAYSLEFRRAGVRQAQRAALLQPVHLALSGVAGVSTCLLIFLFQLYQLVYFGLVALALYLLQNGLVELHRRHQSEKRGLEAELVGTTLLSLGAPVAWIAVRGALEFAGVQVWLLNLLFFLGGVLYVKYRVRSLLAHRTFSRLKERLAFAWPVLVYHLLLLAFVVGLTIRESLSIAVVFAFAPGSLRAAGLLSRLGRKFTIRGLGWNEIVQSVLFAVLLVLALRVSA